MSPEWTTLAAIILFVLTLVLVIWQPRGLNIGWTALGGAVLALLLGVVSLPDVWEVTGIVWNATLSLLGIILISLILDEIGFFEWAALHMARLAGGNGRLMFVLIILLGAAVSAFFSNDGGVLIMTPIVLAMMRSLKFEDRWILPFVMASGFIADATSLPLVISNLVNILSADFFGIGFSEYALHMFVPNLVALAAGMLVLYAFYRKHIPSVYDASVVKSPRDAIRDVKLFRFSWVILGVLCLGFLAGEWLSIPVSFIIGAAALVFLAVTMRNRAVRTRQVVKAAPWHIVIFSIGMYVVVYGLQNVGLTRLLGGLVEGIAEHGLYAATVGMGFIAAALSSVMNNLPTVMINALAIDSVSTTDAVREALVYANAIGSDLGPKMTPIGSLATLLWLHALNRKDIKITWGYYMKAGIILTVPTLFMTLTGLYAWLLLTG
jgi:arsenical pump membrane protein